MKTADSKESFYEIWRRIKDGESINVEPMTELEESKIIFGEKKEDYTMKIVLIGDGAVGKTSLRRRFIGGLFDMKYKSTIGADFAIHEEIIGNYHIKFVIWDLAGQLHFHQVRKSFYKAAHGALIVFDITNPATFDNIKHWVNELWMHNRPVPFVIVGNKSDLCAPGILCVPKNRIDSIARIINQETLRKYGFGVKSLITSAKTGEGVRDAFKTLAIQIIAYFRFQEKQNMRI